MAHSEKKLISEIISRQPSPKKPGEEKEKDDQPPAKDEPVWIDEPKNDPVKIDDPNRNPGFAEPPRE